MVTHRFFRPFVARYVRINVRSWYSYISMRVELFGCRLGKRNACAHYYKMNGFNQSRNGAIFGKYLTIILRNRAEYRQILSRRGRRPSWLKSGDIPQD